MTPADDGQPGRQAADWTAVTARWYRAGTWKAEATRRDERRHLAALDAAWPDLTVDQVDEELIQDHVDELLDVGVGIRSINRRLEILRAVLRSAVTWRMLDRAPSIRLLRRPPRRLRWLTYNQAQRLLQELPPHLVPIVAFSLETGLRKRNVLQLEWSQVDLRRRVAWIHADQAKGRKPIPVPLSPTACAFLEQERGRHGVYVFTYRGTTIRESNTRAWRDALKRAGIRNFRWHDLRHTWASWHAQSGTPLHILQELGGWRSASMVQVYAHMSTAHLKQHVLSFHNHVHGLGIVTRQGQDPQGLGERSE